MLAGYNHEATRYQGIHPRLDRALALLTPEFLASVGTETRYLDGKALYVTRNLFETAPDSETFFEAHRRYLDIHVVVKGAERLEIAHPSLLTPDEERSNPAGDFYAYSGRTDAERQTIVLRPGFFLVAFPDDAHRCRGMLDAPAPVEKVVFKICLE